jgi:hypothetical protein
MEKYSQIINGCGQDFMNQNEDAYSHLINYLKLGHNDPLNNRECDVYIPNLVLDFLKKRGEVPRNTYPLDSPRVKELTPYFADAAWCLSRMGILRPGAKFSSINNPKDQMGYTLTGQGLKWVQANTSEFLYKSPSHFSEILDKFSNLYGDGFKSRSQEACSAYSVGLYFSACAMSGAAAESIMLKVAILKQDKSEDEILQSYESRNGVKWILDYVTGKARKEIRERLGIFSQLIKYRRDSSSHGKALEINEFDAYDSVSRLIWLSIFIKDNLKEVISFNS